MNTIIDNKTSEHLNSSGPSLPGYCTLHIKIINSLQFFYLLGIQRLLRLEIITLFIDGCLHDSLSTEDRIHAFHHVPILQVHGGRSGRGKGRGKRVSPGADERRCLLL